ncbi:unnamed protein product [Paramecium sonneborni]|uniref:Uncharacterized protein n=1 Tax=Paramecium sonneborni TaxID=65129 RepID=A0A8S1KAG4_9CILI|nr:unnamed protein product [Paramecium sonneborni]
MNIITTARLIVFQFKFSFKQCIKRTSIYNHFAIDSLRGGGCITAKVTPLEPLEQVIIELPWNFLYNLIYYSQQINEKSQLTWNDNTKDELFIAIQWFIFNKF